MDDPAWNTEDVSRLRGSLLAAWRRRSGQSSKDTAARLEKSRAWMSMIESGARGDRLGPGSSTLRDLANAYSLTSLETVAFRDLMTAVGTPRALPPRLKWSHNFTDAPDPGWVWIRPADTADTKVTPVAGSAWWSEALRGPFRINTKRAGLLIETPTTVPNPPLEVTLARPGWVDFGRGTIPAQILRDCEITSIDGRDLVRLTAPLDEPLNAAELSQRRGTLVLAKDAARHLGLGWQIFAPHLGMLRPRAEPHAVDGAELATTSTDQSFETRTPVATRLWLTGEQLQRVREARGLVRGQGARSASTFLQRQVTVKNIEHLESAGRVTRTPGLVAFLDRLYRLDGRLGIETTYESNHRYPHRAQHVVTFPGFFVGPIWIQAFSPHDTGARGVVELLWSPWRRRQYVQSAVLLSTRKAFPTAQPLIVTVPQGWQIRAGTGLVPTATDVNHGWYPASFGAVFDQLRNNAEAILSARDGATPPPPRKRTSFPMLIDDNPPD